MFPYIDFLGRHLPSYGVVSMAGFVLGLILAVLNCRHFDLNAEDCAYICAFGGIGAIVGAKVLYLFTVLPQLIRDLSMIWQNPGKFAEVYITGGLVFYGGLLGAVGGAAYCAHYFSLSLQDYFPVLVPVFPLIHAAGRIGCFLAGCCYGIEAEWGIAFICSPAAPNGIKLIPVQLIEAGVEILICLILLQYANRKPAPVRLLGAYLLSYTPVRFMLEYFRGDIARGFWGGFSTSQWLSILLFIIGAVLMHLPKPKKTQ